MDRIDEGSSDVVSCTVCGAESRLAYRHPQANLYRCPRCTHCFADQTAPVDHVHYDEQYGDEDHKNWFENPNLRLFRFIDEVLADRARQIGDRPHTVLDAGCGRGDFLRYLHDRHPSWQLTGVEVTPFQAPEGVEAIEGDFVEVAFPAPFDAVVSLAVIEHVTDPHKFVRRAVECARPGGVLVLMTLNEQCVLYDTARALRRVGIGGPFDQLYSSHHLNHFTKRSLATLLDQHGLRIERRHDGHIPPAAIDFPEQGRLADTVRRLGAVGTFAAGRALGRCYLQTVVCRVPAR